MTAPADSNTPQPPAGDDLVARLREGVVYLGSIEGDIETYDIDSANELMLKAAEAITSQQPAKVYVAVNHTGCIYECEDEDRVIRAARSAFETAVARGQQHTEPVAGEVERFTPIARTGEGYITAEMMPLAKGRWVRKSSYDALAAAKDREIDALEKIARDLTKALVDLTPGGSEYFVQRGGNYYADTEACVRVVREHYDSGHQAKIERVDLRRQRDALRDALSDLADAARSATDARKHTPLINALANADALLSEAEGGK